MPALVILIVCSLSFYIFYKVKYFRTKRPIEKKWISSKSSIALGAFIGFFGINTLFIFHTFLANTISILFIVIGALSIWTGYKAYKFYWPHVVKEYEEMQLNK